MGDPPSSLELRFWPRSLAIAVAVAVGCSRHDLPSEQPDAQAVSHRPGERPSQDPLEAKVTVAGASARTIRFATYNINWGNSRLDAVVQAIRQADVDVVCLQETNASSAIVLRREFGGRFDHLGFYGSVERYAAGGFAVLSRLPVTSEELVPPQHGLFGACIFEIQDGGQSIQVIVVHLQPVLFPRGNGLASQLSVLAAFKKAEETHRKEITQILQHVRTDQPAVIVGDFNSCSTFHAPTHLVNHGFVDSFAAVTENPESHPTWNWPTKYGHVALRIDFIFHTRSIRTIASRVVRTQGSDHYLLLSELETINPERSPATPRQRMPEAVRPSSH